MKETVIPKKYHNRIIKDIKYCEVCQPYDNEEDDGFIWIYGDRIGFWEYLEEIELPEKYFNDVDQFYNCPNCGAVIYLSSDVGLESENERESIKKYKKIEEKVVPDIEDFEIYLEKFPYLGSLHRVGKRIERESEDLKLVTIKNEIWYRARNISEGKIFKKKDMEPPDPKDVKIGEGRFNHYGQSHLYLGSSQEVCIEEINRNIEALCWMQKIQVNNIDRIIDLTEYISSESIDEIPATFCGVMYNRSIAKEVIKDRNWKPEYFISRYISDIAKKHNFNGIRYPSSISIGSNLVLFNREFVQITYIDEPYIYQHKKERVLF